MTIGPDCSTQSPNRDVVYQGTARVAGYIRVSTEDQAKEGFSLDAQAARLQKYCEAKGWSLVGIYKDETSGRATTRPDYRRMMADLHRWDILLVVKQDRIHRNVRNFYEMVDELRANGKQFASVEESIDTTTAMGWAFIGILAIWAQLESDQISERVRKAVPIARAKNYHLGRPPIGFVWVKATKTFELTDWALAIEADVRTYGKAEAGRLHPYEEGKNQGRSVPERSMSGDALSQSNKFERPAPSNMQIPSLGESRDEACRYVYASSTISALPRYALAGGGMCVARICSRSRLSSRRHMTTGTGMLN